MIIQAVEDEIFKLDEIRVFIRGPKDQEVGDYDYKRKASSSLTTQDWIDSRLKPVIGELEFDIVRGSGKTLRTYSRTKLGSIRDSYNSDDDDVDLDIKKSNLRSGYSVLLKNGKNAMVLLNSVKGDIIVLAKEKFKKNNDIIQLSQYNDDLEHKDDELSVVDILPLEENLFLR